VPFCDAAVALLRRNDDDGVKSEAGLSCARVAAAVPAHGGAKAQGGGGGGGGGCAGGL
jgi:hypothetical protein